MTRRRTIAVVELFTIHGKDLRTRPELFGASLRYRIIAGGLVRAEEYVQAMRQRTDAGARHASGDGDGGCGDAADRGACRKTGAAGAREPVHATLVHHRRSMSAAIPRCRYAAGSLRTACRSRCRSPASCSTMRRCCASAMPMRRRRPGGIGGQTWWRGRRPDGPLAATTQLPRGRCRCGAAAAPRCRRDGFGAARGDDAGRHPAHHWPA